MKKLLIVIMCLICAGVFGTTVSAQEISQEERRLLIEALQAELNSGETVAPDFTLTNLEGKEVSLSQFRGKWVVIDFWGSWCGWCIKGFPSLKASYQKYGDKLVIIGVDNGDSIDAWKAAVAKYELPWVNVYNPEENVKLLQDYVVTGFPTKAIVNPEGVIVNYTIGEDPGFFNILDSLMSGGQN